MTKVGKNHKESPIKRAERRHGAGRNGSASHAVDTTTCAIRASRPRPSGSSLADPLIPFQVWKIRQATLDQLKASALEDGRSTGALVRMVLDEWAAERAKRTAGRSKKTRGQK